MKWLTVKEVAKLINTKERNVQEKCKRGVYNSRYVSGLGQDGKQLRISLESVYEKHPEIRPKVNHLDIYNYTGKQREEAERKALIVEMYKQSPLNAHGFVDDYNKHTDIYITVHQLKKWNTRYNKRECVMDLIDNRGKHTKERCRISDKVWDYFYSLYMTQQKRSIKLCYDLTKDKFKNIPSLSTFERKVKKIPKYPLIQYREGEKTLKDNLPSMERDRCDIQSNDVWCSDHHLFDIFVKSENGQKAIRPWLTVFHDMRSNKIVSYLVRNADPNATAVKKCFSLGVEEYGIPNEVYFDNGKDYSSKAFKDSSYPLSLTKHLSFRMIYATPYHGQAKPTERFFRTLEDRFSKRYHTYAGKDAKNRPECMQTKESEIIKLAPELNDFIEQVGRYIDEYNNTPSKASGLDNRTPNQIYRENLVSARKLQDVRALRLLCGILEERKVHKNGVTVNNRTYYSTQLIAHFGEKVCLVFDPENMDEVNVFNTDMQAICVAKAKVKTPFRNTTEEDYRRAKKEQKAVRAFNKKYKPSRELTQEQIIARNQLEELASTQDSETNTTQIMPNFTDNMKTLDDSRRSDVPNRKNSIANEFLEHYERKGG